MMGKTRIEELCYELYGSSKQHDSWQRYAMVRELRELMKRPKASGSDHFERALNDEELIEPEVATDPIETKHELVSQVADSVSDVLLVQVVDSVSDVLLVPKADSHVMDVEELSQKSTSGYGENVAHQLFDQMPLRIASKEKRRKSLKAWKFKFKTTSKRSKSMDVKFFSVEEIDGIRKDSKEANWGCVNKEFKEVVAGCGKTGDDQFKLVDMNELRSEVLNLKPTCLYHQIGHGEKERLGIKKKRKGFKSWMFKYKRGDKKLHTLILSNNMRMVVFQQRGLLVYPQMRRAETSSDLLMFNGKKHDNLFWKEDESGSICCILKLGGVAITCKNVLEKIYAENLEIVACRLRPVMMESSVPSKVIGRDGSKRHGRSEISCEVDAFGNQESSKFRKIAVAFMDISTVVKTQGLGFVHVLHKDAVLDSRLGYLMEGMMEEDQKQQGDSELLVIAPDVDANVELVWESNSLVFHFKTRVWDPGRSLIKDATPREFSFDSTATISFSLLFFLSRITCKFSSLQTLRTRFL